MKKALKAAAVIIGTLVLIAAVYIGGTVYTVKYKKHGIVTYTNDGGYTLTVYQIGDPDFPFGYTHCRYVLSRDGKTIEIVNFDVANDGGNAAEGNFSAEWFDDRVEMTARGEEQNDWKIQLMLN